MGQKLDADTQSSLHKPAPEKALVTLTTPVNMQALYEGNDRSPASGKLGYDASKLACGENRPTAEGFK